MPVPDIFNPFLANVTVVFSGHTKWELQPEYRASDYYGTNMERVLNSYFQSEVKNKT